MNEHRVDRPADVRAVLSSDLVAPIPRTGTGSTLALRASMARFSPPREHPPRRLAVEAAVAAIELQHIAELAAEATGHHLGAARIDGVALAHEVPPRALAAALGLVALDAPRGAELVADLRLVVAVIGRGGTPTKAADGATDRLVDLAAAVHHDPVAIVSLLYQSVDATAALILSTLHARALGTHRVAAVPRTRRVVIASGSVGGLTVVPHDEIDVEIGGAGLEFGAGPHECPGRTVAETIATTVVDTVLSSGYRVALDSVDVDPDGRPTELVIQRA